jgi:hypothetical protein
MKLEITSEQFNLIQDEIIRLENEVSDKRDKMNTWTFIAITDKIEILKEILASEQIDLDKL